jgi:hypothetical protein
LALVDACGQFEECGVLEGVGVDDHVLGGAQASAHLDVAGARELYLSQGVSLTLILGRDWAGDAARTGHP